MVQRDISHTIIQWFTFNSWLRQLCMIILHYHHHWVLCFHFCLKLWERDSLEKDACTLICITVETSHHLCTYSQLTRTQSNGPHKLLGDCGNVLFFHVKEEARVGSKHIFSLPQIVCLYWQSSRSLYSSNNSHLLCYPVASDYLTSFPFSMESNKSFVIIDVALSWNLTSGYPCEGPFNLGIDFWLNMKWPCCGGYL